jgi:hypothetical protein
MPAEAGEGSYEDLVARHERVTGGYRHLVMPHEVNPDRRLLVTFATFNNQGRYASIATLRKRMPMDILAFCDRGNGYYLDDDGGARFGAVLRGQVAGYDPARVLFFGSSMAGHAALRWALELNACCVVSNPQVNLDASIPLAWPKLRESLARIPHRVNLDEMPAGPRRAVLTVLHGRHPIDLENMRRLFALWLASPGMALNLEQAEEAAHAYLIRDFPHFRRLVEHTFTQRQLMEADA